jgi:hypothetical protein
MSIVHSRLHLQLAKWLLRRPSLASASSSRCWRSGSRCSTNVSTACKTKKRSKSSTPLARMDTQILTAIGEGIRWRGRDFEQFTDLLVMLPIVGALDALPLLVPLLFLLDLLFVLRFLPGRLLKLRRDIPHGRTLLLGDCQRAGARIRHFVVGRWSADVATLLLRLVVKLATQRISRVDDFCGRVL